MRLKRRDARRDGRRGILSRSRSSFAMAIPLLALLAFIHLSLTPGLAMMAMADAHLGIGEAFGDVMCTAYGAQTSAPSDDGSLSDKACCQLCLAAHLANGAMPPQHFTLPTESAAEFRLPMAVEHAHVGLTGLPWRARAPPALA